MDGYEGVLFHTEMDTFNTVVCFHNIPDVCFIMMFSSCKSSHSAKNVVIEVLRNYYSKQ